jgi:hypothetical protein
MKKYLIFLFGLFFVSTATFAQTSFSAFNSTIIYTPPNSDNWERVQDHLDTQTNKYILMFKRAPIEDDQGRLIQPVIAIICERVPDSTNLIVYSMNKRLQTRFTVDHVLTPDSDSLKYKYALSYRGHFGEQIVHKLVVGHFIGDNAGLQVICDATEGVYAKVESDMVSFLRSIQIKNVAP